MTPLETEEQSSSSWPQNAAGLREIFSLLIKS